MASNKTATATGVKHNSNLTANVFDAFVMHVQAALNVLYGANVSAGGDNDFGSVATALEAFKGAAADRAKTMRLEASKPVICPRCERLPVKDGGLCVSCIDATKQPAATAKPAVAPKASKPAAAPKPAATAAAQTAKADAPKAETKPAAAPKPETAKPAAPKASKPAAKPLPTSYKALVSLGSDGVNALATQLNVKTDGLAYGKLCGKVWAAVKVANAATVETSKPAAAPQTAKTADKPAKVETFKAGTVVVADGKGGYAIATEAQLWAALEQLSK